MVNNSDLIFNISGDNRTMKSNGETLQVTRLHFDQKTLNDEFYFKPKRNVFQILFSPLRKIKLKDSILGLFPILSWLSAYSWKNDLSSDVISGFTVAVMHIPQGMGYTLLAHLPPIIGIYTAFFPVLIYVIFGTSKHNSMGTLAVASVMVGKIIQKYSSIPPMFLLLNETRHTTEYVISTSTFLDEEQQQIYYTPVEVITAICFIVGALQMLMYVLRLGIIGSFLSETLISGFTTGAAIHVLTSQIKDLLGISLPWTSGLFEIITIYKNIFLRLTEVNWIAIGLSATTMIILIINNECIKQKVSKLCSIPIPMEIILILIGTLLSKYLNLQELHSIKVLEHISTGVPEMKSPRWELFSQIFLDCIPVAIVTYTVTISMGMIFAQKLNYEINSNQELLAMGVSNLFGAFFSCIPVAASLSRSIIQQTAGGKTQLASVISCCFLINVLLWIGPFFEPLPRSVLAGIIVVSLKGMLFQVKEFFNFLKLSRMDAFIWLTTFASVVLIAIDVGLFVGLVLNFVAIIYKGIKPYTCLLGNIPGTDLYLSLKRYKAQEVDGVKIFHYCGSINFASRNTFKNELFTRVGIDLIKELRKYYKSQKGETQYEGVSFKILILDFSAVNYIDLSGMKALKSIMEDLRKLSVTVYIAACSCPVYEIMKKCDLIASDCNNKVFPTIQDAVHQATDVCSSKFI